MPNGLVLGLGAKRHSIALIDHQSSCASVLSKMQNLQSLVGQIPITFFEVQRANFSKFLRLFGQVF